MPPRIRSPLSDAYLDTVGAPEVERRPPPYGDAEGACEEPGVPDADGSVLGEALAEAAALADAPALADAAALAEAASVGDASALAEAASLGDGSADGLGDSVGSGVRIPPLPRNTPFSRITAKIRATAITNACDGRSRSGAATSDGAAGGSPGSG